MNVSATANTKADPTTGLPLFLFNLLNSWRGYVFVVVAVVVAIAVLIVVEVVVDFGDDLVVVVVVHVAFGDAFVVAWLC